MVTDKKFAQYVSSVMTVEELIKKQVIGWYYSFG